MEISPALHPIPERLKLFMLLLSLYLLITIADKDGVGEKRLQLTIRISMSLGFSPVFLNKESIAEKITISASPLAASMVGVGGMRQTSLFTETRPFKNPHLKLDALRIVAQDQPGVLHEGGKGNPASNG
ncbi:hypothetical protein QQP08_008874, partial [Theobroma cacao]